jgi:universal stress protein A
MTDVGAAIPASLHTPLDENAITVDPNQCSVLICPAYCSYLHRLLEPVSIYQRILVAVDLTESSFTIAERGRALAAALGSDLEMLHVVEPPPVVAPIPPDTVIPAIIKTQEELIEAAQKHLANLAGGPGSQQARWRVEVGSVKVELLRVAREFHVELIILGNHGRHGLAFIFGPTEDAVLHSAPCDILAVRVAG